ncbi:serine/threonine protein kinase [Clostridium tetanomorphum]|uniref:Peptidase C45 hydrolase domain-containing protein n=1 Tax=Clostridium tetanomorphum TaxID=1553 RepID=A0A923E501_CLOTT|nr:C45 family peptidase [Clostridium tetanomorphum]KAJ52800.1 hypothetical protein CTM_05695 [Clostridium tetanomorphum DSM 665]MBC2396448.1 hypothetical protein [Clostridium tetanomorphum]MBP1865385.1 serine/threonine protein kinase [Clostridium tetanomorphum]NRS84848.1 serine/threonine protein kinase [Clostridium tetanomorphum]NRZ98066.1 serine/threonine protein kinase [Clostridium tetanomorphum]
MSYKIKFIEAKGTPYERGKITGIEMKKAIRDYTVKYEKFLKDKDFMKKINKVKGIVEEIFPEYLQEVYGRAEGALVNKDLYFLTLCAEILDEGVGCTSLVYKREDGTFILAHNEDDCYKPGNAAITKCTSGNQWFVTYDYSNMPFGNAFSYNSHGIVKTINYCYSKDVNIEGIPRYFIQRYISEATSLDDFIRRCSIENRGSGFHATAIDINNNLCISIEVTSKHISVKEINSLYIHTNHYIHNDINNGKVNTQEGSTSIFRLETGKKLLEEIIKIKEDKVGISDFLEILNYRGENYFNSILGLKGDPNFTCSRFAIDTKNKDKVWLEFFYDHEGFYKDYNIFRSC